MHNIAENGIAAHWKYKESRPDSMDKDDKRLEWLREMAELYQERKSPREFLNSLNADIDFPGFFALRFVKASPATLAS